MTHEVWYAIKQRNLNLDIQVWFEFKSFSIVRCFELSRSRLYVICQKNISKNKNQVYVILFDFTSVHHKYWSRNITRKALKA